MKRNPDPEPTTTVIEPPLVNEKESGQGEGDPAETPAQTIGRLETQNASLLHRLAAQKEEFTKTIEKMEYDAKRAGFTVSTRRFRIFLVVVQGFVTRGLLDSAELAKKPGSEKNLLKHAAGLAQVAEEAAKQMEF